jgi:periplasmic protein TonB
MRQVQPTYPPLAKSARVQGAVEFTATISKDGKIENLQLIHGHPLLVNAAKRQFCSGGIAQPYLTGSL